VARVADKEELAMRQAELSKVRALMFYEQQKRHRINKIKSKLYRKIRKRQKDRREGATGDDSGADDNDEGDEANDDGEFQRVKERMDLRHKNTGKWAKMALTHTKADKTLRYVLYLVCTVAWLRGASAYHACFLDRLITNPYNSVMSWLRK
jgi:U3 small nucleolar RNA-associated protein 14